MSLRESGTGNASEESADWKSAQFWEKPMVQRPPRWEKTDQRSTEASQKELPKVDDMGRELFK